MRLSYVRRLSTRPLTGTWYRAVRPAHYASALAVVHTATIPGRFNSGTVARPAFPILYLGEDHQVTLFEVAAILGSPLPGQANLSNPANPWAIVNVSVQLNRVADLCRAADRRLVQTTVQELTGDWRGYGLRGTTPAPSPPWWTSVPTQRLGAAMHARPGLEGFLTFSAKVPTKRNLAIFPDKLRPGTGSFVEFTDPATGVVQTIP